MKQVTRVVCAGLMGTVMLLMGCASSYQDRIDALTPPEETTEEGGTPSTLMSADDIIHSGACIVNADCPSDRHCRLGVCVAECGPESACSGGLVCSKRGTCVDSADYVDVDPDVTAKAPVAWSVDERVVRLNPGKNAAAFTIAVGAGGPLNYRVEVEPASARGAVALSATEGIIASGGQLNLNVAVDREVFGTGDHRVAVHVVSDGGSHVVVYEFSNGLSGRYAGFVDYQNPGLGRMPMAVDLIVDESGTITGRVVAEASLLFPDERPVTGFYDTANGMFFFETMDRYEPGGGFDPFKREIGREVYFYGEITEQRVIKGSFEEVVSALLPQLMTVSGEFYLKRMEVELAGWEAEAMPAMPAFPATPTSYQVCAGVSAFCDEAGFRADMTGCSTQIRDVAFNLGNAFVGVDAGGYPTVNFGLIEECQSDVAGVGTHACVDFATYECLRNNQQEYLLTGTAQVSEYRTYFADLMNDQRLHAFIGNDYMVEAYRTEVQTVSSPLLKELAKLENALGEFGDAEMKFFETKNMKIVGGASSALVADNSFELLRVPLEYIRSSHTALKRIAQLTMRKDIEVVAKRDELRMRAQEHARVMFLEGLALARLVQMHGGSFEGELAQIADALRGVAHTTAVLEAGLNPLGYPVDYVPFVYDPARSQYPTNFAQLVQTALAVVERAVQKAQLANSTAQEMAVRTEDIEQRMTEIEQQYESEIQNLCGIAALNDLSQCGQNGGEVGVAFNLVEQQYFDIEKLHKQVMDLNQMVKIKNDTAARIIGLKEETLAFVESSGAELEALDIAEGDIRAAMLRSQGMFSSIGGFLSGALSLGAGLASVAYGNPAGGATIAGGVSGMIDAGLGMASAGQSIAAARAFAQVAADRTHLNTLRQLVCKQEEIGVTELQTSEMVKQLLIQLGQVNMDLNLADIRLGERTIRVNNLLEEVDLRAHQHDVLMNQALRSVHNPMSNLSFRLNRDHAVLMASNEFDKALAYVYLAARALEHELNIEVPQIESQLMQVNNAQQLSDFLGCLETWYDDYAIAFGSPHEEVTQLSLREDILGFTAPITDEVTGEVIQPEEIFRRVLLNPQYITQTGAVEFPVMTSIIGQGKNFSSLVCNDRIKKVRVMLVGDFLGDNEATVMLRQEGNSYLRDCASDPVADVDIITTFNLDRRTAVIQAGVNDFGIASPNYELTGRSVASDRWVLIIPPGSVAPNNADIDLLNIDDVVIEITHEARSLSDGAKMNVFSQCNI